MVWIMNKIYRFVVVTILLTMILLPISNIGQAAIGGTVTELTASYNNSTGTVKVTGAGEGIAKEIIVIEILKPNGDLLYFGTASLDNGSFESSITVGALAVGTYKVRSADYTGGSYNVAQFSVASTGGPPIDEEVDDSRPTPSKPETPKQSEQKTELQVETEPSKVTATIKATGVTDRDGQTIINIPTDNMNKVIADALVKAEESGINKVDIKIAVETTGDNKSLEIILPKEVIRNIKESRIDSLTIDTPIGSILFDEKTLKEIGDTSEGDLVICIAYSDKDKLSSEAKELVEDRPAFDFSVMSGEKQISKFNGKLTVRIPYSPKPMENVEAIVVYYINPQGKPEIVRNCMYNENTGQITFKTNHFSTFAIGYNSISFDDVQEDAWYSKAVSFIAARNITAGTSDNNYTPMGKLNRAQFIVMVMRAYGIQPDTYPVDNFADGGNTYYTGYLSAAKRLNISQGVGNNLFLPDKEITRQEMFALLYNTLKTMEELPTEATGKRIEDFFDVNLIESWAKEAMKALVEGGIISGSNGRLEPKSTSTRGEMAQLIYNILKK